MNLEKVWLRYLVFILIGIIILSITLFSYVQYLDTKYQLIEDDRELTKDRIQYNLDVQEQKINLIGKSIRGLYLDSNFDVNNEHEQFMNGILRSVPEIKKYFYS
ncbi:MAG: hypothetical protein HC944_04805 [Nanoarchaeota archaeon]|nr:hypothetical protein [Nanoarchaeota archaeon]